MRAFMLFWAVALPLMLTGVVSAQPEGDKADRPRQRDPEMREKMIKEFDADGDGKLNDEERQTARETMRERRGGPDGQGQPGRGGPQARRGPGGGPQGPPDPNAMFDRFDANGDGQLSRDEFMKLSQEMRPRRGGPGGPGGPRADRGPRPGGPPEGGDLPRRRPRPDGEGPSRDRGDGDRPRVREESDRPLQNQVEGQPREGRGPRLGPGGPEGRPGLDPNKVFDRFDENGDDQLSREEFMNLTESIRERMQGRRPGGPRGEGGGPPGRDRPRGERPGRPPRPDSDSGAEAPAPESDKNTA